MLYFQPNSTALNVRSQQVLDQVIGQHPSARVSEWHISGHADPTDDASEKVKLSLLRALSVQDYLIARGVPADAISLVALGERQPIPDGDESSARNRRVEVRLELRSERDN